MRTALAITSVELKRFLKDRSNIFFVFIFPLLLVLFIGAQFGGGGGGTVALSGVDGALRDDLVAALADDDVTVTSADAAEGRELVARGRADVGLVVTEQATADYDAGADLAVQLVVGNQAQSQATAQRVQAALDSLALDRGQVAALTDAGLDAADAGRALDTAGEMVRPARIEVTNVSEIAQEFAGLGQFDYGASSQVLLFVFFMSLAGATTLIQSRRIGVTRRTLAAPVTTGKMVVGQALGRLAIAATQGIYIMVATVVLFDVNWGNLVAAATILIVFGSVGAAAAMLAGSVFQNDEQAAGVTVVVALGLGALGGSMLPVELFSDTMLTIARTIPHYWALDAFADVVRHDASVTDILPQLGVLVVFTLVIGTVAVWRLRATLTHR